MIDNEPLIEDAKRRAEGPEGQELLRLIARFPAALFWSTKEAQTEVVSNGTVFFMDIGRGPFAVTAYHVLEEYRRAESEHNGLVCRIAASQFGGQSRTCMRFALNERLIDFDRESDICTFRMSAPELQDLGRDPVRDLLRDTVHEGEPIYYAGFPGRHRKKVSAVELEFGACVGIALAKNPNEKRFAVQFEREHLVGNLQPDEDYNTGGMSGGPVFASPSRKLVMLSLAGMIREGSNEFEIMWASRLHHLNADGTFG